ncbi:MAG TPA: hypothetical protein PLF20_10030, partial [Bacteroidales bacterium]|nr:hypothetical protein [Bacteroidales bacterium]
AYEFKVRSLASQRLRTRGRTMKAYSQLKENLFLDISDLPTGLYRVKVISVNGLDTQALQIIK